MIIIDNKSNCCGCGACMQICPKNCISMQEDAEGFLYPYVQAEFCVNCNLCENICPVINAKLESDTIRACYVAYAKDDKIRMNSSSGGLFTLIAKDVLSNQGTVYGAAFDKDYLVHHVKVNSIERLYIIQRSKYVQSRLEDTYLEAKKDLDKGIHVLFSGTPCQIAGLKRYLGNEYDNLITIDVLCHGVPSPKLWKQYLYYLIKPNNYIKNINFRDKISGWKNYSLTVKSSKDVVYQSSFRDDVFMQMFLNNICLRPSCYNCRFKCLERSSDITLGDAWGIHKIIQDMDDDKGTSVVLVHSLKGEKLFSKLSTSLIKKMIDVEVVLPKTSDSRKSVKEHKERKRFFWILKNKKDYKVFSWWIRYKRKQKVLSYFSRKLIILKK